MSAVAAEAAIVRHTLGNGLRVVVAEERSAPVAGVAVHYGVGFRSEARSGFAHLFEHLMFQGGAGAPDDHFHQVESAGGFCNASTRQDYTDFYDVVPAEALEHVLALEAARMREPKITQRAVRTQASVVKEEILGKLRRPYGGFPWPKLSPVLFRTFANAHDGYGDHAALDGVTVAECAEFFDRCYSPSNAVLTVAGDVDVRRTLDAVERLFGSIPARPAPAAVSYGEPEPDGVVEGECADPLAPLPAIAVGHRVPDPAASPRAHIALSVLAAILASNAASRLPERIRRDHGQAVTVTARAGLFDLLDARDPDMWILTAVHPHELDRRRVLDALDAELGAIAAAGPAPGELLRARLRQRTSHHRSLDHLANRVRMLGRFELLYADPGLTTRLPELFDETTVEEVAQAALGLRADSRAVLTLVPGAGKEDEAR
ncbi:peptidase M16 [Microbispora rosea subsp. aerata]|nr:pitrilysin family protein [Microbispora rosea]GGO00718.1 peptidase M16 [Microbispora rosea subsp. aerata]GIH56864.1 peptidase M16 [Microbispora rosea subsp. aerata]GLJ84349.1 peptidase M16 [Microbispora rosea subsp. aerata]